MSEDGESFCAIVGGSFVGALLALKARHFGMAAGVWQVHLALLVLPFLTMALPYLWRFVPIRMLQAKGDAAALVATGATTVTYIVLWPFFTGHTDFAWIAGTVLFFIVGCFSLEAWLPEEPQRDVFAPLREPIYGYSRRATTADLARAGHAAVTPRNEHAGYLEPPR